MTNAGPGIFDARAYMNCSRVVGASGSQPRLGWLLIGTLIGVLATVYVQSSGARLIWPNLK